MTEIPEPTLEERAENAFTRREEVFNRLDSLKTDNYNLNFALTEGFVMWANDNEMKGTDWTATPEQVDALIDINKNVIRQYCVDSGDVMDPEAINENIWDSIRQFDFGFSEDAVREDLLESDNLDFINVYSQVFQRQSQRNKMLKETRATDSITATNLDEAKEDFKTLAENNGFEYRQEPRTLEETRRGYIRLADKLYDTNQPL